ncbi:MAG TPA: Nramp family divalent metal transporter [Bacteroidales bacterium]|nr:Nramp family divalent metal transporter [Bacteroidales bacterium]
MGIRKLLQVLGPGLLYAGAAIGVSHLVQSTRAGAGYGFDLIWILLIANILKYPFFEFAPRYASATNESLIHGYHRLGRWAIIAFAVLTIATMFTIQAAVTIVTAGLFANFFQLSIDIVTLSSIILAGTVAILIVGKFSALDKLIKLVIVILALSTVVAVISALSSSTPYNDDHLNSFDWTSQLDIFFLIAFIGWMPAPIDVSVWSSLWNIEKARTMKLKPTLGESLLDFRIGYVGTALMALSFMLLGAMVMHGSGEELSSNGAEFAGQLINMYTVHIGEWSRPFIALAALTTMFSTTLTCIDAYPRVLLPTTKILFPSVDKQKNSDRKLYWFWILMVMAGALILLRYFATSMRYMVDVATTISFITAPILAWMNYKVVRSKHIPKYARPGIVLRVWSWIGMIFLSLFTIYYILWRLEIVSF